MNEKRYVCSYRHGLQTYHVDVWAIDEVEARHKLRSMANGTVDGEHIASVPGYLHGLPEFIADLRNWWHDAPFEAKWSVTSAVAILVWAALVLWSIL